MGYATQVVQGNLLPLHSPDSEKRTRKNTQKMDVDQEHGAKLLVKDFCQ